MAEDDNNRTASKVVSQETQRCATGRVVGPRVHIPGDQERGTGKVALETGTRNSTKEAETKSGAAESGTVGDAG